MAGAWLGRAVKKKTGWAGKREWVRDYFGFFISFSNFDSKLFKNF
jgi:hypothetical protein